ncbi:MAG: NADPH-dependent F420 reductase [Myxococcaceae bacterium]
MKIGIIGSGMIGSTAARLFVKAGHDVAISNSRGPDSLRELVAELGPKAHAATVKEAAEFGELVLLAIPYKACPFLPPKELAGKIVIDATNYYAQRDGEIDFGGRTSSELLARHIPGARVVKAFNTMYFKTLGAEAHPDTPMNERLVLFVAGDDAEARRTVARLIEEIGFAPVETGSLAEGGRRQQPGSSIYNHPMRRPDAQSVLARI